MDHIELLRENRRLIVLFFVAVVLIGPSFTLGYVSGHSSAAVLPSASGPVPVVVPEPQGEPAGGTVPQAEAPPTRHAAEQPAPGQIYLQVAAGGEDQSAAMIAALRKNGFPAITTKVPEKPDLYRILVGPLAESGLDETRTGLQSKGFPADSAIKRIF